MLGLAVAVAYGAADFFGGLATRRSPLSAVIVLSQAVGLGIAGALVLIVEGTIGATDAMLAAAAGIVGGAGLACLYRGLAIGRMNVVAPTTAAGAAVLPFVWGLVRGERPSAPALAGAVLAVISIAFVSRIPGDEGAAAGGRQALLLAIAAGAGFGVVFIVLSETGEGSGLWPLLVMRATSVTLFVGAALATGRPLRPHGPSRLRMVAVTGVLDVTANVLFVFGTQQGLLSVVAVLSSLYPAVTVVLARAVLAERLGRMQTAGLALAGAGILLIAMA